MTMKHVALIVVGLVAVIVSYLAWEIYHFSSAAKFQMRNFSGFTLTDVRLVLVAEGEAERTTIPIPDLPPGGNHSQKLNRLRSYVTVHYSRNDRKRTLECGYIDSNWDTYLVTVEKDETASKCVLFSVKSAPASG